MLYNGVSFIILEPMTLFAEGPEVSIVSLKTLQTKSIVTFCNALNLNLAKFIISHF